MITETKKRSSTLHVTSWEEEMMLVIEGDKRGGEMDIETAYKKGMEFINNLKL